jgi:probable HAF family extracellular repeat protein
MSFTRSARTLVHLTLALAAGALQGQAVVTSFTDIGTLGGDVSFAYGINDSGEVVGESTPAGYDSGQAFLYSGGNMTNIDYLPELGIGSAMVATAINNAGQYIIDYHEAIFSSLGEFTTDSAILIPGNFGHADTTVDTLGAPYVYGLALNNAGEIAGYGLTFDATDNAFLHAGGSAGFNDNGNTTSLGTLGGGNSYGYGINDSGEVVGTAEIAGGFPYLHAFLYTNGTMTDLGTLGGDESQANGINNSGQIAGWANTPGDLYPHAFLYGNGTMTDLGTLGGDESQANGLNAAGEVVGNSTYNLTSSEHAFFYADGTMYDLNTLAAAYLSNGSTPGFISLNSSTAINNLGQIIGQGTYRDALGNDHNQAFLLTVAVPEPRVGAAIAGGTALLYGVVRRRPKHTRTTDKMECGGFV